MTDPNLSNNSATDTTPLAPQVTLAVVKTDGSLTYTPGGIATYTVTVTDTGASDAADVTVSDSLPPGVTLTANVTCVANGSASCGTRHRRHRRDELGHDRCDRRRRHGQLAGVYGPGCLCFGHDEPTRW